MDWRLRCSIEIRYDTSSQHIRFPLDYMFICLLYTYSLLSILINLCCSGYVQIILKVTSSPMMKKLLLSGILSQLCPLDWRDHPPESLAIGHLLNNDVQVKWDLDHFYVDCLSVSSSSHSPVLTTARTWSDDCVKHSEVVYLCRQVGSVLMLVQLASRYVYQLLFCMFPLILHAFQIISLEYYESSSLDINDAVDEPHPCSSAASQEGKAQTTMIYRINKQTADNTYNIIF